MAIEILKEKVEEAGNKRKGSGWIFKMVNKVQVDISQYVPLMGGSYIPTPPYLRSKGVLNVKNENDQKCFQWAILSAMYPAPSKHAERLSNYNTLEHELDFSDLTFPVIVSDIAKFERKNNVSIHLYGCDKPKTKNQKPKPYTLQMSSIVNTEARSQKNSNHCIMSSKSSS